MDPITTASEAREAENRLTVMRRIVSALRTTQDDRALTDEDRKRVRWTADDLVGDFCMADLESALRDWEALNDYGSVRERPRVPLTV